MCDFTSRISTVNKLTRDLCNKIRNKRYTKTSCKIIELFEYAARLISYLFIYR